MTCVVPNWCGGTSTTVCFWDGSVGIEGTADRETHVIFVAGRAQLTDTRWGRFRRAQSYETLRLRVLAVHSSRKP